MAIDRFHHHRRRGDCAAASRLHNNTTGETATIDLKHKSAKSVSRRENHVRGVIAGFQQR
jgi:hypothetical protein